MSCTCFFLMWTRGAAILDFELVVAEVSKSAFQLQEVFRITNREQSFQCQRLNGLHYLHESPAEVGRAKLERKGAVTIMTAAGLFGHSWLIQTRWSRLNIHIAFRSFQNSLSAEHFIILYLVIRWLPLNVCLVCDSLLGDSCCAPSGCQMSLFRLVSHLAWNSNIYIPFLFFFNSRRWHPASPSSNRTWNGDTRSAELLMSTMGQPCGGLQMFRRCLAIYKTCHRSVTRSVQFVMGVKTLNALNISLGYRRPSNTRCVRDDTFTTLSLYFF